MRDVVVVKVGRQQVALLVVGEDLVRRRAERLRRCAVHLAFDDLRVDPVAAVVDRGVVHDLVDARLGIDLERASVDLRRVGERQVPVLALEVRLLERRPVDVAHVERDVEAVEILIPVSVLL